MSGITPILDTLLHQVLGRRVEVPLTQALNEPVRPLHPGEALPALRSDSRLDPRQPLLDGLAQRPAQGAPAVPASTRPPDGAPSSRTHFSMAAKAIADVLSRFPAPPSAIRPAAPLLSAPPEKGVPVTTLAQQLRASIERSGLFYQSHLARWHRGELPLTLLAREPQLLLTRPVLAQRLLQISAPDNLQRTPAPDISLSPPDKKNSLANLATPPRARETADDITQRAAANTAMAINDTLQGLVRHQLEVLATPVVHWQGDVWTGLFMSLSLGWSPLLPEHPLPAEEDSPQREQDDPEAYRWQLSLTLSHAHLGRLQGSLELVRGQLVVTLQCEHDAVAVLFSANKGSLCRRLEAAGFETVRLHIKSAEREPAGDER